MQSHSSFFAQSLEEPYKAGSFKLVIANVLFYLYNAPILLNVIFIAIPSYLILVGIGYILFIAVNPRCSPLLFVLNFFD